MTSAFAVWLTYSATHDERAHLRPAHAAWLDAIAASGSVTLVSPFADRMGGLLVVHDCTPDQVGEWIASEPYGLAGFSTSIVKELAA